MSEVEAKVYISKRTGLKLHICPEKKKWDADRREDIVIPGTYAKFVNSRFVARTKEEIDYIDAYCKKNPSEVWPISKTTERLVKAMKKVDEEEEALTGQNKAGQGPVGKKTTDPVKNTGKKGGQGAKG